jgi:hypothetical protein
MVAIFGFRPSRRRGIDEMNVLRDGQPSALLALAASMGMCSLRSGDRGIFDLHFTPRRLPSKGRMISMLSLMTLPSWEWNCALGTCNPGKHFKALFFKGTLA